MVEAVRQADAGARFVPQKRLFAARVLAGHGPVEQMSSAVRVAAAESGLRFSRPDSERESIQGGDRWCALVEDVDRDQENERGEEPIE